MNISTKKSTNRSTADAISSLHHEVLPCLQRQLSAISNMPADQRSCDQSTRDLVVAALDLFGELREWLGGDFPVNRAQKPAPAQNRVVATSLVDALVERVELLDSDQLLLQSAIKAIAKQDMDGAHLHDLRGLASRFADDLTGVREVVDILKQSPSSELIGRLSAAVGKNAVEAGLRYEVTLDFSKFDLDHAQMDGLVDALAAAAQLLAVSAISSGDPVPVILIEGRKASGLIRAVVRNAAPLQLQAMKIDAVNLEVLSQQFAQLKGAIFEGSGGMSSLVCEVPSSLRSMKGIVVRAGGENYALPVHGIVETMRLDSARIQTIGGQEFLNFRSNSLPLVQLTQMLGKTGFGANYLPEARSGGYALVVASSGQQFGLVVDELIEHRDLALRPLGGSLTTRPEVVGGAVDSDGRVIMVIDARKFRPESLADGGKPAA